MINEVFRALVLLFAMVAIMGCAAQYREFPPHRKVPCAYCPPPPLPYHDHYGCDCGGTDSTPAKP